jgi:hypothetical protein
VSEPRPSPVLNRFQIDGLAETLLEECYGIPVSEITCPIQIEDIIESHLGLGFEMDDLEQREGELGINGALYVQERMIRIDSRLDPVENRHLEGRYRFTCAHEVGHWRLHRHKVERNPDQLMFNLGVAEKPIKMCRVNETVSKPGRVVDWDEYQADVYASSLLMPRPLIRQAFEEGWRLGSGQRCDLRLLTPEERQNKDAYVLEGAVPGKWQTMAEWHSFVRSMATHFKVSWSAMAYRLDPIVEQALMPKPLLEVPAF